METRLTFTRICYKWSKFLINTFSLEGGAIFFIFVLLKLQQYILQKADH